MKKRRIMILVGIVLMAVGFSAVSTTFYLNGSTSIASNTQDFDVRFTKAVLDTEDRSNELISTDGKNITFETNPLSKEGDESVLHFTIANTSKNYNAEVYLECDDTATEYASIKLDMLNRKILAQSIENGRVLVKLKKSSLEEQREAFNCELKVNAIERNYDDVDITQIDISDIIFAVPDYETWAPVKKVQMVFPEEETYTKEYSTDYGETWTPYKEEIEVTENNTTIIARLTEDGYTLSSSTFVVSKIDGVTPEVSLEGITESVVIGTDLKVPSKIIEGESGSTTVCKAGEKEIHNTNELTPGNHSVKCTITSGAGLTGEAIKEITVLKGQSIKGESILKILEEKDLKSGYYTFEVEGETTEYYDIHLYNIEGNQEWNENQTFGDAEDVGTKEDYAQNMVIVKVNGDLTIGEGVTVAPYYTEYGGPKGFTLYVTGKLENNGTIDNSHGAYAKGQNVYLWKNADGSYETVPAVGAVGAPRLTSDGGGNTGKSGENRQTGGGGSGGSWWADGRSGSGGTGTSYSGGSGGVGDVVRAASNEGGEGGTGNPGVGNNGTGGLLVLYANEYENNGLIRANGTDSSVGGKGGHGSSGGGSMNIFYTANIIKGIVEAKGGLIGGAGGAGTVTYTQISLTSVESVVPQSKAIKRPEISLADTSSKTKAVSIDYRDDTQNEYSTDLGKTWNTYNGSIEVDEPIIVLARSKKNGEVVSSSSFTVTKVGE